jgi:hypothetical protein
MSHWSNSFAQFTPIKNPHSNSFLFKSKLLRRVFCFVLILAFSNFRLPIIPGEMKRQRKVALADQPPHTYQVPYVGTGRWKTAQGHEDREWEWSPNQ